MNYGANKTYTVYCQDPRKLEELANSSIGVRKIKENTTYVYGILPCHKIRKCLVMYCCPKDTGVRWTRPNTGQFEHQNNEKSQIITY